MENLFLGLFLIMIIIIIHIGNNTNRILSRINKQTKTIDMIHKRIEFNEKSLKLVVDVLKHFLIIYIPIVINKILLILTIY